MRKAFVDHTHGCIENPIIEPVISVIRNTPTIAFVGTPRGRGSTAAFLMAYPQTINEEGIATPVCYDNVGWPTAIRTIFPTGLGTINLVSAITVASAVHRCNVVTTIPCNPVPTSIIVSDMAITLRCCFMRCTRMLAQSISTRTLAVTMIMITNLHSSIATAQYAERTPR